ncbi:hypothetical protein FRZ40_18535 [Paraburkholderia azotifigens]|uniref:Uncharacterized protein n=1 Tax=Paraburkholderia azotifigens TaxID=2057004 RepID=A0A5C6VBY5_9BURK|nr:hypothetical protein FRZ40_18535 [Paraburkholderia azotifigens]
MSVYFTVPWGTEENCLRGAGFAGFLFVCDAVANSGFLLLVFCCAGIRGFGLRWHPRFGWHRRFGWHPRFRIGLLALPLCGAALTFFAAAKKVSKESGLTPPVLVIACGPPTGPALHTASHCLTHVASVLTHASPTSPSRVTFRFTRKSTAAQVANGV